MGTYKVNREPHYDGDATMAVPEPCQKQLVRLISCEKYHEL